MARKLYELGSVIESEARKDARNGKGKWYVYAKPYVEALQSLESVNDNYYADSGRSVVAYALANLGSWRGDVAKQVKAELKLHLDGKA